MPKFFSGWTFEGFYANGKRARRIITLSVVVLLVVVSGFQYIIYRLGSNQSLDSTLLHQVLLARLGATMLSERLSRVSDLGLSLSTRPVLRSAIESGKWDEAIQILHDVPDSFFYVDRVFLSDTSGTLMTDYPALPNVRGKNFADRDWYKGVVAAQKPYVSSVYKRAAEPQYNVIAVASPVRGADGTVKAYIVVQIKLETIVQWSQELDYGRGTLAYFVDKYGQLAAHPLVNSLGPIRSAYNIDQVQSVLRGESGSAFVFDSQDRENKIRAYAPVELYGWGMIIEQPTRLALAEFNENRMRNLYVQAVFILIFILFALFTLVTISRLSYVRQREKTFLDSAGDGLVAIDKNWNIVLWNPSAARITGWGAEEVVGKPFRSIVRFVRERDRGEDVLFISDAMLSGEIRHMQNHTILICKDGTEIPVGDSAAPVFDDDGDVIGAIIVFRNAREERVGEHLKSSFAYASHQLRTPVTAALWNTEVAIEECKDPSAKEKIRIAYHSIQNLQKLVSELLEVSEIDQQTVLPKMQQLKLSEVVDNVMRASESLARERDIKIEISPVSAAAAISSDKKLLSRALSEVADNAIRYSPSGATVLLKTEVRPEGLIFEISDSGIGIPQDQQGIVFTKFFRGNNVPKDSVGAGLGLYIAKEYIQLLGGKIWYSSQEKIGTTFTIMLPLNE